MESSSRSFVRIAPLRRLLPAAFALALTSLPACRWAQSLNVFAASTPSDCLPNITLTNQYGKPVSLASLKGKPVLVDFIYTSCAEECLLITRRMTKVAQRLGSELGSRVTLVSITIDPENDGPAQLRYYAKHENADRPGWLFLTGTPKQIDAELANFHLVRRREADGSVQHISEFFLLDPQGHELLIIDPMQTTADNIASHIEQIEAHG
ncbi:MAG TPA: SCO family protein [Candidatus Binataceae bacterium]|nr:SCO family protein [Candidatus Binataceae bacterium]